MSTAPNGLTLPARGTPNWDVPLNNNFTNTVGTTPTANQIITGAHGLILSDPGSTFVEKNAGAFGPLANVGVNNLPAQGTASSVLDVETGATVSSPVPSLQPTALSVGLAAYSNAVDNKIRQAVSAEAQTFDDAGNTQNYTGIMTTGYFEADHYGRGTLASLNGIVTDVFNERSGSVTTLEGLQVQTGNFGSGTVTDERGIHIINPASSGTVTRYRAILVDDVSAEGSDPYALYITGGKARFGSQGLLIPGSTSGTATIQATTTLGGVVQPAPNAAPADGGLTNGSISLYLDEAGNNLKVRVKYSNGTLKTATIALV